MPATQDGGGVVGRFLQAMAAHDWTTMGDCVADNIVRVGPFGDRYEGREEYVAFISRLLPTLPGYEMVVDRITYSNGGRLATAQLAETVEVDGTPVRTPEALVFDIDAGSRITHIEIYTQHLGPAPALAR